MANWPLSASNRREVAPAEGDLDGAGGDGAHGHDPQGPGHRAQQRAPASPHERDEHRHVGQHPEPPGEAPAGELAAEDDLVGERQAEGRVGGEVDEVPGLVGQAAPDAAQRADGDHGDQQGADGRRGHVGLAAGEVDQGLPPALPVGPGDDAGPHVGADQDGHRGAEPLVPDEDPVEAGPVLDAAEAGDEHEPDEPEGRRQQAGELGVEVHASVHPAARSRTPAVEDPHPEHDDEERPQRGAELTDAHPRLAGEGERQRGRCRRRADAARRRSRPVGPGRAEGFVSRWVMNGVPSHRPRWPPQVRGHRPEGKRKVRTPMGPRPQRWGLSKPRGSRSAGQPSRSTAVSKANRSVIPAT